MPRVTIKGLTLENEKLDLNNLFLREETRVLKADLHSRECRSRSRRRKAAFKVEPVSARTMMALDIVCKRDRDHVIDEQKKIIAKQAQEIELLRSGGGPIGPVLLAAKDHPDFPEILRVNLLKRTETVKSFIQRTQTMAGAVTSELSWGEHSLWR